MSSTRTRRLPVSTVVIATALIAGVGAIVYSRVTAAPEPTAVAASRQADVAALVGTPDPKAQALIPAGYAFVTPGTLTTSVASSQAIPNG